MLVPISRLANTRLLIHKPYLDRLILDSSLHQGKETPPMTEVQRTIPIFSNTSSAGVTLTNELSKVDSGDEVIFYHPIEGLILAHQEYGFDYGRWEWKELFSTMTFVNNLKAADESSNVIAHFLHINSCGGEAWMLDIAAEAMRQCKKPIYAFIEQYCCSAAYWFAANANVVKAFTINDMVGSIGCMATFMDISGYYKLLGIEEHELYATKSDLKNKKVRDILAGKPEEFIKTVMDPQRDRFENMVRSARPQLAALAEDHPVMRGELYYASDAIEIGLIDGILSDLGAAIAEAYALGISIKNGNHLLTNF